MTDEDQPDLFADDASADAIDRNPVRSGTDGDACEDADTYTHADANAAADEDLVDGIADLIEQHGDMGEFIWEALLDRAEHELRSVESFDHLPRKWVNGRWNCVLPCAVAVLDRFGFYEPTTTLDGRAHDYDAVVQQESAP